jgi:hypothetical protein
MIEAARAGDRLARLWELLGFPGIAGRTDRYENGGDHLGVRAPDGLSSAPGRVVGRGC